MVQSMLEKRGEEATKCFESNSYLQRAQKKVELKCACRLSVTYSTFVALIIHL